MVNTRILCGDAREKLKELPDKSVQMCVTSPPYYALRCYGGGQLEIGIEQTPTEYIHNLVNVFQEVKRVLKDDGTLWLNIGDTYAANRAYQVHNTKGAKEHTFTGGVRCTDGIKPKDLFGIPWTLAFALREDGWYLRQDIIWEKPNAMPESVKDRCTKSHEYIFLLSKSKNYYFDAAAIQEKRIGDDERPPAGSVGAFGTPQSRRRGSGNIERSFRPTPGTQHLGGNVPYSGEKETRNKRDVWHVATIPYSGAHFATFPEALVEPCILAGSREGDTVLDPFNGAGTTGVVCVKLGRNYIGTELKPEYVSMAEKRIADTRLELEYGIKARKTPKDTFEYESSLFDEMSGETA